MIDLNTEIKNAMLAKEPLKLSVLRALKGEITKVLSAKGRGDKPLTQDEEWNIIRKEVAKRKEAALAYMKAGDIGIAASTKEIAEEVILESFLPSSLSEDALVELIRTAISNVGAETKRDTGKVIAQLSANEAIRGQYDPKEASKIIASLLS